jgi:hypothetical protein
MSAGRLRSCQAIGVCCGLGYLDNTTTMTSDLFDALKWRRVPLTFHFWTADLRLLRGEDGNVASTAHGARVLAARPFAPVGALLTER